MSILTKLRPSYNSRLLFAPVLLPSVVAAILFLSPYSAARNNLMQNVAPAVPVAALSSTTVSSSAYRSFLPLVLSANRTASPPPHQNKRAFLPMAFRLFTPNLIYPPLAPGLGYGMQLEPTADYPRALRLLKTAGFGWAKVQVRWQDVEPAPGDINWVFLDSIVNTTQALGVRLLFSIVTAPAWSRPPDADLSTPGPPSNMNTYAAFVGSLAARYKGNVHAYEIWNEQNLAREWGGPGQQSAAAYVSMLRASYRAVKAADPEAIVVAGALTPAGNVDLGQGLLAIDDVEYFRQMYQSGIKGYFDVVGVHPSGFNNSPDANPLDPAVLARPGRFHGHRSFYFRNFERYREVMVEYGDSDKKLWFTEFGWASEPNPKEEYAYAAEVTEEQQAAYLVRAFQIARSVGYVGPMFVWNLNFAPSSGPSDSEARSAFSILKPDWSPRPAYNALAAMQK